MEFVPKAEFSTVTRASKARIRELVAAAPVPKRYGALNGPRLFPGPPVMAKD